MGNSSGSGGTKINFVFIRHGIGCHNYGDKGKYNYPDAPLSNDGERATKNNAKILKQKLQEEYSIVNFDIFGGSPLIRAIETANIVKEVYTMDSIESKLVYIFPFLRELDEMDNETTPYNKSRKFFKTSNIDNPYFPAYNMVDYDIQKDYLTKKGINVSNDFIYSREDKLLRKEAGDILVFIENFIYKYMSTYSFDDVPDLYKKKIINILIVTHAGVLKDFCSQKETICTFHNNEGVIVTVDKDKSISNNKLNYTYKLLTLSDNTDFDKKRMNF